MQYNYWLSLESKLYYFLWGDFCLFAWWNADVMLMLPIAGPPYSSGNYTGGQSGGPGTPGSYPQNVPSPQNGSFNNMLPMSPMNNNLANMNLNNGEMMGKGMNPGSVGPGQYPLSPPDNSPHLRQSADQVMNNHSVTSSSQSQNMSNHVSSNGTQQMSLQSQQVPPTSQPSNSVGDDLNFDPTAIIDDDGSGPTLDVSLIFYKD